ncbi:MAG TPA: cyclase family protein [Ignavibacteria bacterium]|nr:hypothetical protein [Bacteroidota bacterium]HRI85593.1 cyclase family protein [Ignavibacteria bacterium]HRJ98801.1 cyclase family protein [Ignavibacteria bacterium]
MEISFTLNGEKYKSNLSVPLEISIPLDFYGSQPNTYDVEKASAKPYKSGEFIGDTRTGGGCNFEEYRLIPHCNGTHTECVGHISYERISIDKTLEDILIPASLITVTPEKSDDTDDTYIPEKNKDDYLITEKVLREKINNYDSGFLEGLIIRTLPNSKDKMSRRYMTKQPAFFSVEAIKFISELNVKHLILDLPSVDRTFDEGKLTVHHIYWNVPFESHDVNADEHSIKTITEMAYVNDEIRDGEYLLNIQIPGFKSDASPSRLFLFEINKKSD